MKWKNDKIKSRTKIINSHHVSHEILSTSISIPIKITIAINRPFLHIYFTTSSRHDDKDSRTQIHEKMTSR